MVSTHELAENMWAAIIEEPSSGAWKVLVHVSPSEVTYTRAPGEVEPS